MELKRTMDKELQLLPVGIWERIVKSLEDSKDIQTVIKVCPSLEDCVEKYKCRWLFDQIILHVRPWLSKKELLNCRQVCKRWCHGVDNYLENHPSHRAFDHCNLVTGQLWQPKFSRAYDTRKNYQDNPKLVELYQWELVSGNWDWLCKHPIERNPFVGRSINFNFQYGWKGVALSAHEYWTVAMAVLQKFGSHIWFITFLEIEPNHSDQEDPLNPLQTCQRLLEILRLLPNLKSLTLKSWNFHFAQGNSEDNILEHYLESRKDSLPPLPQLETLQFGENTPVSLADILIRRYSTQIRRLRLPRCLWKGVKYFCIFPRLTEFYLWNISHNEEALYVPMLLFASKLWSLRLESAFEGLGNVENEIIRLLSHFPRLNSFQLKVGLWKDPYKEFHYGFDWSTTGDPMPPLKCLRIEGNLCGMNFDFLKHFPSLEYLSLVSQNGLEYFNGKEMSDAILWESMLPKLKELTLGKGDGQGELHLSRAMFERLKNRNTTRISRGTNTGSPNVRYRRKSC